MMSTSASQVHKFIASPLLVMAMLFAAGSPVRAGAPMPEAQRNSAISPEKKLIDWCTYPLVSDVALHVDPNEKQPFAGMVLRVTNRFADEVFGAVKVPSELEHRAVEQLKSVKFQRYTDNFILVNTAADQSKAGVWFNDARWSVIAHNARLAASIAQQGGLKGIMLDTEQRVDRLFDFRAQANRGDKSFEQYTQIVTQRGRQFAKALADAYPQITLILTKSTSAVAFELSFEPDMQLDQCKYGLLPAFVDGMIEGAGPQARIVDGFRRAFHFTDWDEYVAAHALIKDAAARLSANPAQYRDKVSVGFGVNLAFHADQVLEDTLHYAQAVSDRYVWVWNDHRDHHDPLARLDRPRVFAVLNSRLARAAAKPTPISDLSDYWGLKSPAFHAAKLESRGYREVEVPRFGSIDMDVQPEKTAVSFGQGRSSSVSFDYRRVSVGLDLGTVRKIDLIQIYGGRYRPGNYRLDETNVSLWVSDDNVTYRRVPCTYREPGAHVIELADIDVAARYFKVAHTIADAAYMWGFTAGTDFGGGRAFVKE